MDFFHGGSDGLIVLGISALVWFFKYKLKQYDEAIKMIKSPDEILAFVNGKYLSRRESEMMNEQRAELKTEIADRFDKIDDQILVLRHEISTLTEKVITALAKQ